MNRKKWIDVLIILAMVCFVFFLCQPVGRTWDDATREMYTGEEGVYASDTDTYYYLRVAKQFSEEGFSSIRLFYGRSGDSLRTPLQLGEVDRNPQFLSALAAFIWYFLNAIGIKVGIYSVAIVVCSLLLSLCTIPVYLFLKDRTSRCAAVFGALVVTLAPPYMRHSFRGFFDTDALIGLLAIILVLSLYECFTRERTKDIILFGTLACVAAVLFFFTWITFYVYVAIAVGTSSFGVLMAWIIKGKVEKERRKRLLPFVFCGLITLFTLAVGAKSFVNTAKSMLLPVVGTEPWPSASMLVGELEKKPFMSSHGLWYRFMAVDSDYMSYFGGGILFAFLAFSVGLSVICAVNRFRNKKAGTREYWFLFFAIGSWFLSTLVLALLGIRFMEFVIIPCGIIMAFAFNRVENILTAKKENTVLKRIVYCGIAVAAFCVYVGWLPLIAVLAAGGILLFGFAASKIKSVNVLRGVIVWALLSAVICDTWLISSRAVPYIEKPTAEAMSWIRENTEKDAVLVDFWGLGYIFQYYSERRTVADGGTYNGTVNYWLATMMTTDNLDLAVGIAKMLQQSGLDGTDYAVQVFGGNRKAAEQMKIILPMSKEEASKYLTETSGLSIEECEKLLYYTHPEECPNLYFLAENNLLTRSASLSVYSDWDFSGKAAAPRSTLLGQYSVQKPLKGEGVFCDIWKEGIAEGWKIKLRNDGEKITGILTSPQGEECNFNRTVYARDGERVYDINEEVTNPLAEVVGQALIILEEDERLSVVICDERQLDSALFRLYLFDGKGQDVFEKVYENELPESVTGDPSRIQRKIGTGKTRSYINCGISVWKVKNGS